MMNEENESSATKASNPLTPLQDNRAFESIPVRPAPWSKSQDSGCCECACHVDTPFCPRCNQACIAATTPPTSPSDAAMRAAEEIQDWNEHGEGTGSHEGDVSHIAAIVTRHLAAPARNFQKRLFDECVTANWDPERKNTFAEEIAHLHEELSEAFRAWRRYKDCEIREVNGKLEGVPIEFADALIGMFYNAELHGFDLLAAIETKHQFNLTRNYVQEGRQLHAAATTSPETPEPIGHAKNPDAFCLICDEHPCRLIAPVVVTADNEGELRTRAAWIIGGDLELTRAEFEGLQNRIVAALRTQEGGGK